jgi:exonuclease SbcD
MADRASFGAERFLAVGKGFTIPLSLMARSCFDYVALGHVHRHQNLNPSNNPPVIYPGSIERVDFSEEKEDKGYVLIELEKGKAEWQFCPLPVRPFCTINVNLVEEADPEAALLKAIKKKAINDAVVRLIYKVRSDQLDLIDNSTIHQALSEAHSYTIRPELASQLARPRLPELGVGSSMNPMDALKTYLESQDNLKDIAADMLEAAQYLLDGQGDSWLEIEESGDDKQEASQVGKGNQKNQLRLL